MYIRQSIASSFCKKITNMNNSTKFVSEFIASFDNKRQKLVKYSFFRILEPYRISLARKGFEKQ